MTAQRSSASDGRPILVGMSRIRHPSALLVALLVLVGSFVALSLVRHTPRPRIERETAVRAVLRDPVVAAALASGDRWTSVRLTYVDDTHTRVSFSNGPRIVADAALRSDGTVDRFGDYREGRSRYGAPLSHAPWLVALGCLAFAVATAVLPLRRLRNLDVLALLTFVASVVLLNARFATASTVVALPPLVWLAVRCAWFALGRRASAGDARPLLDALTPAWSDAQRVRWLRIAIVVAGAATIMITLSARGVVDVGQAVMEGATLLWHGTLPYGHPTFDIFHGDTYPLLGYVAYMPIAAVMPVHDEWDLANGALVVAAGSSLAIAWLLARLAPGIRRRDRPGANARTDAERAAGLRAALAWLAFPPLLATTSSGTNDVLLAALLVGALLLTRRPLASTSWLIAACWFKLVPFALLPIWLARLRGRQLAAALAILALSALATVVVLLALGGTQGPGAMLEAMAYQLQRQSLRSPWTLFELEWLQPLAQAAVLALVAGATLRVRRDAALAGDPVRLAALAGAVLLMLQLAGNYWTYLYLAWVVPCIVVSLLADAPRSAVAPDPLPLRERTPAVEPALV
jgi:hypothetical protein